MSWNYLPPGNNWLPKPWEQPGNYFGPAPFKPPSSSSTSDIVEASGTTKPGGKASTAEKNASTNRNSSPPKPWEQNCGNSYGGLYGGYGGSYGSGLYWGPYGGPGMYGWSMHNSGFGCPSTNGTSNGGPSSDQYQNNPFGPPPSPPDFWISFLRVMQGIVNFFGRFATLIDQNTQAFHMFMIALLQMSSIAAVQIKRGSGRGRERDGEKREAERTCAHCCRCRCFWLGCWLSQTLSLKPLLPLATYVSAAAAISTVVLFSSLTVQGVCMASLQSLPYVYLNSEQHLRSPNIHRLLNPQTLQDAERLL
ncbi:peroxisomal membrane protein 13-like isoform X5 [Typha angustifolia]|uniref:peroxisomal membrane protein 13-like isoform X5 n=1 Tax=Typha angustifolia TaxID=59011 RepID=UPI003C2DD83E